MKGAGSLGEPGRRKHWTERAKRAREARSEARPPSEPGAFEALLLLSVLSGSDPGAFEAVLLLSVLSGSDPEDFEAVLACLTTQLGRNSPRAECRHPTASEPTVMSVHNGHYEYS